MVRSPDIEPCDQDRRQRDQPQYPPDACSAIDFLSHPHSPEYPACFIAPDEAAVEQAETQAEVRAFSWAKVAVIAIAVIVIAAVIFIVCTAIN
jgi:hypothetical protein